MTRANKHSKQQSKKTGEAKEEKNFNEKKKSNEKDPRENDK